MAAAGELLQCKKEEEMSWLAMTMWHSQKGPMFNKLLSHFYSVGTLEFMLAERWHGLHRLQQQIT